MNNKEQLADILKKEDLKGIIPYLKGLSKTDKKQLLPDLKKHFQYYRDSVQITKNKWGRRATETQDRILVRAALACFGLRDFRMHVWQFDEALLAEILTFYQPSWLNKYINDFANDDWFPRTLNYLWVMEQTEKGLLTPNELLLTKTLCNSIITYSRNWKERTFTPENLEKHDITLKEHFWYLFHYENNAYHLTRWMQFTDGSKKEESTWIKVICQLEKLGKLPRKRLLEETLAGATRNFNRNQIGWYADLFLALVPTIEELLELQPALFQVFHATQSKPINMVLKYSKQLAKNTTFDGAAFLENAPILLASETKSVVNSTLMILATLAQKQEALRSLICVVVCDAFLHQVANIQTRAAKIIAKYGDPENIEIQDALLPFQMNLLAEAKKILIEFIPAEELEIMEEDMLLGTPTIPLLNLNQTIRLPETFDDLAFLANEALVGNESWHIELLPAALLKFQDQMTPTNINKLKPAFQRAYKYIFEGVGNARISNYELLLAHFLGEYIQIIEKHPSNLEVLQKKLQNYLQKEKIWKAQWSHHRLRKVSLSDWKDHTNNTFYKPLKLVLLFALDQLKNGKNLPLLSTPTHAPHWIDPKIFVQRLSAYQKAGTIPNQADWQLAISRIAFEDLEPAIDLAKACLTGELLDNTLFLLANQQPQSTDFQYPQVWKVAALTKGESDEIGLCLLFPEAIAQKYLGILPYKFERKTVQQKQYNYQKQTYEKVPVVEKKLLIGDIPTSSSFIPQFWEKFLQMIAPTNGIRPFFLYDYLKIKTTWYIANELEVARIISMVPNNVAPFIATVTKKCLTRATFWGETDKKVVRYAAQALLKEWKGDDEMHHLFISNVLICSDKINRMIAAEIWLKGIQQQNIDAQLMGRILGQMVQIEFFPLKRLLDIMEDTLFQVSNTHNRALLEMIEEMISQLPKTPIRNTKRLLELYWELLANMPNRATKTTLTAKLIDWQSVSSLKKVVGRLVAA